MAIGKRLEDLIKTRNTNVNELSIKIGISPQTIYSIIKRDNMKVDLDVLFKISKALGVNVDYFYDSGDISDVVDLDNVEYAVYEGYKTLAEDDKRVIADLIKRFNEQSKGK